MEHRQGRGGGFTSKYRIHRLVYVETFAEVNAAIRREKEIKSWRRERREALIEAHNPTWVDLIGEWAPPYPREKQIPHPKSGLGMTQKTDSGEAAPR
jgi:putative endonuclease